MFWYILVCTYILMFVVCFYTRVLNKHQKRLIHHEKLTHITSNYRPLLLASTKKCSKKKKKTFVAVDLWYRCFCSLVLGCKSMFILRNQFIHLLLHIMPVMTEQLNCARWIASTCLIILLLMACIHVITHEKQLYPLNVNVWFSLFISQSSLNFHDVNSSDLMTK